MYGLLIEGIYDYIIKKHSEDIWEKSREQAGVRHSTFSTQKTYSETVVPRLAKATADTLGMDIDEVMYTLGKWFVSFVGQYGYDMMLKVLGRRMRDFLNGLDNLHEYLRLSYPKIKPPSFHIAEETPDGLTMHYRTKRKGFVQYVKGQIEQVGKVFFTMNIEIEILSAEEHGDQGHFVLRLYFDNRHYMRHLANIESKDTKSSFPMSSKLFFEAFPYHIVFDENMTIRHIGHSLKSIMPWIIRESVDGVFHLVRPNVTFSFENVETHSNVTFEMISLEEVGRKDTDVGSTSMTMDDDDMTTMSTMNSTDGDDAEGDKAARLMLKGQMKYMESWNCFIFLGSPVLENLDKMFRLGIYITDLSMHDVSRDLVLVGTQQSQELTQAFDQAKAKSRKLESVVKQLDDLIKKGDELLSQMLPRTIAMEIRAGKKQSELTSNFDGVTIMFSDIVGFLSIVKALEPRDVMQLLNNVFSKLDSTIEKHDAYKVETIADQYMVISGAPDVTEFHPVIICELALDFIDVAKSLTDPTTKQPIQLRIGSHTGPAVAGVVGQRCPRYCFFGDTVNTSSRMNSNGEALKIHISNDLLDAVNKYPYSTEERGSIQVKGKGEMKTFWLLGRTGPIKGIPKKKKVEADTKSKTKGRKSKEDSKMQPPPPRMRQLKEEPTEKPASPKKPPPKPPSPKKEPPKPKPPSPKKESPKPKPPTPKKEPPKPRTPTPKKEPPKPKPPTPKKEVPPPKPPSPKREPPKPKSPSPKRQPPPPEPTPTIKVPEKPPEKQVPTNQVEPITIAVSPAARENTVVNAKTSPTKETITGKKVYDERADVKPGQQRRNGVKTESPVISEKMNGSKASMGRMEAGGVVPPGKAKSCTCSIL